MLEPCTSAPKSLQALPSELVSEPNARRPSTAFEYGFGWPADDADEEEVDDIENDLQTRETCQFNILESVHGAKNVLIILHRHAIIH